MNPPTPNAPRTPSSFVPDRMPTGTRSGGASSSGGGLLDIIFLVGIIGLAAALSLAAGVFLYHQLLSSSEASKAQDLAKARAEFEPALVEELLRLDARLEAANTILSNHLAPSELFSILEALTLQSIAYDNLEYTEGEDGTITLTMDGHAESVNGVALQADVFGNHNTIDNPIFSNLDFEQDGVAFSVTTNIKPAGLRYSSLINTAATTVETSETAPSTNEFGAFGTETNTNDSASTGQ